MSEQLGKFLSLVPNANWRGDVPRVWNEELRVALSEGFVTIGFARLLKLTDAGREALSRSSTPARSEQERGK